MNNTGATKQTMDEKQSDLWEQIVLNKLICLISEANGGRWPQTCGEWGDAARHFGMDMRFIAAAPLDTVELVEDKIYLPYLPRHSAAMLDAMAHETAEAGLVSDAEPQINIPYRGSLRDARHRLARQVEQYNSSNGEMSDAISTASIRAQYIHNLRQNAEQNWDAVLKRLDDEEGTEGDRR